MNKKQNRTSNVRNNKSNHDSLNIIMNQKLDSLKQQKNMN